MDMRYNKWEWIIPTILMTLGAMFIFWMVYSVTESSKQSAERRIQHAVSQCEALLSRSRTYEDSTDVLRDVVSGYKCVYWLTKDTSNVK